MKNDNIFDIAQDSRGEYRAWGFGFLEHTFALSFKTAETIKLRAVRAKTTGKRLTLRYSVLPDGYPQRERDEADVLTWIGKHYDMFEEG